MGHARVSRKLAIWVMSLKLRTEYMVKPYFESSMTKLIMATDCNVETENQEHEAWGDIPDVEVGCKIR